MMEAIRAARLTDTTGKAVVVFARDIAYVEESNDRGARAEIFFGGNRTLRVKEEADSVCRKLGAELG